MGKIYLTSDLHFGHDREFIWRVRGFNSVEEMNETIIKNWNDIITDEDDIYVLGDLMLGELEKGIKCLKQLKGRIHVIIGNHDTSNRIAAYKELGFSVDYATMFKYNKYSFYLSHYPTMTSNLEKESLKQCILGLYGHTHQTHNFYQDIPMYYHVGVDSHNCTPVLIDDIIIEMEKEVDKCKNLL